MIPPRVQPCRKSASCAGPDDWPEQKFRPLAVDFSFNFAALEMAEREYEAIRSAGEGHSPVHVSDNSGTGRGPNATPGSLC